MFGLGLRKPITTEEAPFYSSLNLWLAASEGVIHNAAGLVSQWSDLSGSGNNFTQSSSAQQPIWSANGGPDNQPCVSFIGGSPAPNLAAATIVIQSATANSIFIVQQFTTTAGPISLNAGNGANGVQIALDQARDNERDVSFFNGTTFSFLNCGAATVSWEQWSITSTPTTTTVRVNGVQVGTTANVAQTGTGTMTIGASVSGATPMVGAIAEVLGYKTALSLPQVLAVETYLKGKYGI